MTGRPRAEIEAAAARGDWVCGHPRTEANSKEVDGPGGPLRCRACRQAIQRRYNRRTTATRDRGREPRGRK